MSNPSPIRYDSHCVHVSGEMTIYTCGQLKPLLLAELAAHPDAIRLDLSQVVELDTAGLQLLMTARRFATEAGRDLKITQPSQVVADVLELCKLDSQWGLK